MKRKADEDEDFQRGGATADAGEAAEAPERAEAFRKPKDKTKAKKAKLEDLEEVHVPLEVQRRVRRFRTADLAEGSLVLACVRDISEEDLTLCLAYNLLAYVQRAEATDGSAEISRKSLAELYQPGKLVVAVVLTVGEMKGQKLRIEASLRPALVNAGLTAEHLRRNMWLPATVAGEEEHVLKVDFGVNNLTGVLKKKELAGERLPDVGSILMVGVLAVTSLGTVRCSSTCAEPLSDDAMDIALLKAGSLVTARVRKIFSGDSIENGLSVTFCGAVSATIHGHHASHAGEVEEDWKKNQRLVARILAVLPGDPPIIHLTLLPHLLDWKQETLSQQAAIGDFLSGEVHDFQTKYGCRVLCQGKSKGELFGFCPASRLSDPDVEVKAVSVQTGNKATYRVLSYNFMDGVVVLTRRSSDLKKDVIVSVSELSPGQLVSGVVTRVAEHGIHVKISDYVSGHVHLRQLTDVPLAAVPKRLQVGSKMKCRVLHVHAARRQLTLTAKKSMVKSEYQLTQNSMARPNMLLTGYISSIHNYGAIVSFYGGAFGLIPTKDMEAEEAPALGMAVQCRVAFVDVKRDRLGLTLNLETGVAAQELAEEGVTFGEVLKKQAAEKRLKRAEAGEVSMKDGKPRRERKDVKLAQIKDPEKELQSGSLLKMRIRAIHGLQVFCTAPVGLRGHVHATQLVDLDDVGSGGTIPLQDIPEAGIVRTRLLRLHKRTRSAKEKSKSRKGLFHLELTCRPSLMAPKDRDEYEAAAVRRQSLKPGSKVAAAILAVQKNALMVEVADGLKGRISLLDSSADPSVLRLPAQHFTPGQVFQTRIIQSSSAHKTLDLSLLPLKQSPVLARLQKIHDQIHQGVAADMELPNKCWGKVHITEVFDVWTQNPTRRLSLGSFYEVAALTELEPGKRVEVSLRPSLVHGHKEAADEKRPASAADLEVGQKVSGYVVSSGPQGVFVALSRTLTARIKLRALSDVPVMKEAISKMYPNGTLLRDMAVVDIAKGDADRVELSLLSGRQGALTSEQLAVGDLVSGWVKAVEAYGLFVRLDNSSIDAFVHKSEISDSASIGVESYPVGTKIAQAKILKLDGKRVSLTLKPSNFTAEELEGEDSELDDFNELLASVKSSATTSKNEKRKKQDSEEEKALGAGSEQEAQVKKSKKQRVKAAKEQQELQEEPEEPWKAKTASRAAAFDFAEFKVDSGTSSDAVADDAEDEHETKKLSKRQKKAKKKQEDEELRQQEEENADGRDPESVEDFERLLLTQGDTSILWIRYMAFHLKTSDLEKARQVAERAVKHVGFADGKERFNVWVAFMNLECTFGTEASAEAVFRRAASHNEAKQVYLQLARIHERNKKPQLALKAYEACSRKFAHSKKVWIAFLTFLYQQGDAEGARKVLPKSLAALEKRKHPLVVSKAALLEYQTGSPDRGRSIFEGLLDSYPKRTDLWSVYLDAHIKAFTPPRVPEVDHEEIRALLRRCCSMSLKATKMRFFFKRWLDFETRHGDAQSQEHVRSKAREYVESQA